MTQKVLTVEKEMISSDVIKRDGVLHKIHMNFWCPKLVRYPCAKEFYIYTNSYVSMESDVTLKSNLLCHIRQLCRTLSAFM